MFGNISGRKKQQSKLMTHSEKSILEIFDLKKTDRLLQ